jgi:FkbM family methyltransferase
VHEKMIPKSNVDDVGTSSLHRLFAVTTNLPRRIIRRSTRFIRDIRWMYLGYDFIPLLNDIRLKINADDRLGHLLRHDAFEDGEQSFLKRFLRPGDVFVDVGANIGLFTLLAGAIVGRTGRVIAFEPCSTTFERLVANVTRSRLSHVECHQCALSSTTGTADLSVSRGEFGAWNSLAGALSQGEYGSEQVRTLTWDDFSAKDRRQHGITLMKIDVEGWEGAVIDGASKLLKQHAAPVLQVEFTPANALAAGTSCQDLFQRIGEYGYRLYRYNSEAAELREVCACPGDDYCNLYAIKNVTHVLDRLDRSC